METIEEIKTNVLKKLDTPVEFDRSSRKYSITSIIKELEPEFDVQTVAERTHKKHFNNPESPYYQKSVIDILAMWDAKKFASSGMGKQLDDYIGMILNNEDTSLWELDYLYGDEQLKHKCDCAKKFITTLLAKPEFEFITREKDIFYSIQNPSTGQSYIISGRFDALFLYFTQGVQCLYLIDWKNTESIVFENKYGNLLGPCKKWPNANGYLYAIQLAFYKNAFRETYGITSLIDTNIVQFPSGDPQVIPTKDIDISKEFLDTILLYGCTKLDIKKEMKKAKTN